MLRRRRRRGPLRGVLERRSADGRGGRSPAVGHDVVVTRVLDAATGLGELLTRADAQAVADGAVEILAAVTSQRC